MNFNSINYILFLPLVSMGFFAVPQKYRNLYLLMVNYYFYFCSEVRFFLLMPAITAATFAAGKAIDMAQGLKKKLFFIAGLFLNVTILTFFKYNRFFLGNISALTGVEFDLTKWILPAGISFYIFMAVSYLADIMLGKYHAEKSLLKFAVYISFFPHILMGPIDRASKFLPQLEKDYAFDYERIKVALQLMAIGYFKKIAVADVMAKMINRVHSDLTGYTGLMLIFTAFMYSIQLYADFSGYSDIARGSAMIMGFDITENFKTPYLSTSIKEFWRNWHISLSNWFTEYIYFPLGGSRVGKTRHMFNLFMVFFISGIWHGNTWNFVVWGAIHGLYRIINEMLNRVWPQLSAKQGLAMQWIKRIIVFLLVSFGWIFFRSADIATSLLYISRLFVDLSPQTFINGLYNAIKTGFDATPLLIYGYMAYNVITITLLTAMDLYRHFALKGKCLTNAFKDMKQWQRWLCYYTLIALIMAGFIMNNGGYGASASFIYNNF